MDRGSKEWWTKSRALLQGKERTCSVPALQTSDGQWAKTAQGKADTFVTHFESKFTTPVLVHCDTYTPIKEIRGPGQHQLTTPPQSV